MFKSFLTVFWRNLRRNRLYAALNILGLVTGITSAILIIVYIQFELSYDTFHPNVENKYKMALDAKIGESESYHTSTPSVLGPTLVKQVPEVLQFTRIWRADKQLFRVDDQTINQDRVYWADANFYQFFGYELLQGDPKTALNQPNQLVLTASAARKYFGSVNPLGKMVQVGEDQENYRVTGVAADPPGNSHFEFEVLLSFATSEQSRNTNWLGNQLSTYVALERTGNLGEVKRKIDEVVKTEAAPIIKRAFNKTIDEFMKAGRYTYDPVPLLDLHLYTPEMGHSLKPAGDIYYIYLFGGVGAFILIIAAINFMNFTTASATKRAKEVGMRRTMGSGKQDLMYQFMTETFGYVLFATVISVLLSYYLLPVFNRIWDPQIPVSQLYGVEVMVAVVALLVLVTVIAGLYPSVYLTSFKPVSTLKGVIKTGNSSARFRKALVVGQFVISITLIICTLLITRQVEYMNNKELGIVDDHAMVLKNTSAMGEKNEEFRKALISQASIAAASYTSYSIPGSHFTTFLKRPSESQDHVVAVYWADEDHADALGIDMIAGRFFDETFASDTSSVVINQSAINEFGFKEPLGKEIRYNGNNFTIVGIMEDFHFESPLYEIEPLVLFYTPFNNEMIVRFEGDNPSEALASVTEVWNRFAGDVPLTHTFLSEDFAREFAAEEQISRLLSAFTIIAMVIAGLGLIGLSTYMAERRVKEIGIRKVLGASSASIVRLFTREYMMLMGIAFVIAVPISMHFIRSWLEDFAYKISVDLTVFIITGLAAVTLVFTSIIWQALRAALSNPVHSIRDE